jgi:hypothetical protein
MKSKKVLRVELLRLDNDLKKIFRIGKEETAIVNTGKRNSHHILPKNAELKQTAVYQQN